MDQVSVTNLKAEWAKRESTMKSLQSGFSALLPDASLRTDQGIMLTTQLTPSFACLLVYLLSNT
eukprot:4174201-Pyramimonas_sp.AAC.2